MPRRRINKKIIALFLGDLTALFGALYTILLLRYAGRLYDKELSEHFIAFSIIFFLWIIFLGSFGFYELRFARNKRIFLYRLLQVMTANTILAIVIFYLFPFFTIEPRRNLFLIALLSTAFIFVWRSLFNLLIIRAASARVLFLGINTETIALADYLLSHPQLGQRPVGFVSAEGTVAPASLPPLPHLVLDPARFAHTVRDLKVEMVIVSPEMKGDRTVLKALFGIIPAGVATIDFAPFHEMLTGKIPLSLIGEAWFLENLIGIKKRSYEFAKRGIDILLAIILGAFGAITLPFVALAIVIESPGPVFFRQQRVGRNSKIITLLKYRSTHRTTAPATQTERTKEESGVYTRAGKILRASYIDEIPQIINILKGEMSFVGPRPERPEYVAELKEKVPFYEIRLLVPPGISGWAQINMQDDAAVEDAPEKMQYDLYYVKNRSFLLDLLIMLRTIFTLLRREGR
ncbi:MAG: sugar transferase [Candidatus Sungiibacteriota bacterium]